MSDKPAAGSNVGMGNGPMTGRSSASRLSMAASILFAASSFLLLASCGDSGSSGATNVSVTPATPTAGGCDNASNGFCNDFSGADYASMNMRRICESQKMVFLAGGCPSERRVGSCLVNKGNKSESYYRYYTGFPGFGIKTEGGSVVAAERQCAKLKGEWSPN